MYTVLSTPQMTVVHATPIPDDLLVDGKNLQQVAVRFDALPECPRKDLLVFLDNSSISVFYLPVVKTLLAEWIEKRQPDCHLTDGLTFNLGVKNLLFSGTPSENAAKIRGVLHSDSVDEINLTEPFYTVNAYLDSKLERDVRTRTTIVFVTFSSKTSPNPEFGHYLREFLRRVQHMPVDVHVIGFGGLQPASLLNMLTGLGSLSGTYQACLTEFEPEKILMDRDADKDVEKTVAKWRPDMEREFRASLSTLDSALARSDVFGYVGMRRVAIVDGVSRCIMPKSDTVCAGFTPESPEYTPDVFPWEGDTVRRVVLLSVRLVLNSLDRYTKEGKAKRVLENLLRAKKGYTYYGLRDEAVNALLRKFETMLMTALSGSEPKNTEFALLVTRCTRLLA